MPFKKVGSNEYTSPSGRHFNGAQVRLFYANGGKFPGQKGKGENMAKGGMAMHNNASYAQGGEVLGRTRNFMKEPDPFRDDGTSREGPDALDQDYGKTGSAAGKANPKGRDKSLKAVKPRG